MPPGRKPSHTREEFVAAAIAYADEQGIWTLTLRALGQSVGVSTTAVYRYFRDKDALIVTLRETLLSQVAASLEADSHDPVATLMGSALAYRSVVREHPCLSQIMGLPALEGDVSGAVQKLVVGQLEELGLTGPLLVRGYQQIESFVVGTASFDFSDAPRHLDDRQQRLTQLGHPDFIATLPDEAGVERNNETAFEASLRAIIESLLVEQRLLTN